MGTTSPRKIRGKTNYLAGIGAETSVELWYERRGCQIVARRFLAKRGEIDLIVQDGSTFVFVEVKKARNHANAALRVTDAKILRLWRAAEEYLSFSPNGQLTETRFDVALVDDFGAVEIIENAFAGG